MSKLKSMQQNPPIVTKNRKEIVRSIRPFARQNEDGTVSTHVMESGEGGGKYKYQVNPTNRDMQNMHFFWTMFPIGNIFINREV